MVQENKKGLYLGIAAASAVVGAAFLYHYIFNDADAEGEEEEEVADLQTMLTEQGLDKVKKSPNGQGLDPQYMVKLLNFVSTSAKKRRQSEIDESKNQRREHYKAEEWDQYREIVQEQFMKEDQQCQVVMQEALELLPETSMQQFQMTMQMMAQNPQYAQLIMAAQQGKLPTDDQAAAAKAVPKLTKEKCLKAFETSKKLTMEAMKKQMTAQTQPMAGQDEMQQMITMMTDQAKVEDALFIAEGVQNDELEEAMMYYMQKEDPEIKKAMTQYMMEMQKEMAKMQGGGAGFPPGM